jgi:uncharacterized protein with HEPN domain
MKDIRPFLRHIVDECEFIEKSLKDKTINDFLNDEILKRAIVRSFEIIGEASKHVPNELRYKYNHIPWKHISGLRDVLIHKYFGIDYANVWKIATEDICPIKKNISKILKELK